MRRLARRPRTDATTKPSHEDGFAMVDAVVALLILASTLVFSLEALEHAARLSRIADETSQATHLAQAVLASPGTEDAQGRAQGLTWRLAVKAGDDAGARSRLCRRALAVQSARDGRLYRFSDVVACPSVT